MLIHIKGRTHVQVRLVEPIFSSINRGDCYLLVTKQKLFRFVGEFSNVIERTRSQQLAAIILENKDLGCSAFREYVVHDSKDGSIGRIGDSFESEFWRLLKRPDEWQTVIGAGHADEDDLFEQCLIETNMVYEYKEGGRLCPLEGTWGTVPKVEILDENKVLVFNFGAEVYVWNGKNALPEEKRAAMRVAQEYFAGSPLQYEECDLNPISFSQYAGHRHITGDIKKATTARPDWCLLARINQHMETILFQEKFLDWPEEVKRDDLCKDYDQSEILMDVQVPDGVQLYREFKDGGDEPNLVLENANLGRGNFYYDTDTMRHFNVVTQAVDKWSVNGETGRHEEVANKSQGHFYSGESFIVRWKYQLSCTVRELSGKPSERATVGRTRCVYFCWQGADSTANEKGAAAFVLSNDLDKEKGAQVRLSQGEESTAFVRLFQTMIVHRGKAEEDASGERLKRWRMFIVTGNDSAETILTEVDCRMEQLRSRTCFVLVHGKKQSLILWMGKRAPKHVRELAQSCVEKLAAGMDKELFGVDQTEDTEIEEVEEGEEEASFFEAIGSKDRSLYWSDNRVKVEGHLGTPRLFHFTSINGMFEATEIFYNLRAKDLCSAYPIRQSVLYEARQPTLFMIDDGDCLWLWCGWWPKEDRTEEEENGSPCSENRAGEFRWLDERRAALETCISYWRTKKEMERITKDGEDGRWGVVVWAGLEPPAFKAIFPDWRENAEAKELNELVRREEVDEMMELILILIFLFQDGRTEDELTIKTALEMLSRRVYPFEVLKERPLPEGVDPTRLERYLSPEEFQEALEMSLDEFKEMPIWKQTKLKKDAGLF